MNAGVAGAEDVCTRDQILAAADAFDYLGMTDLAQLVRHIPGADFSNGREERMNHAYRGLVLTDELLWAAIVRKYADAPGDFDSPPTEAPAGFRTSPTPSGGWKRIEFPHCDGLLTVHELTITCSNEEACRFKTRVVRHQRSVIHRATNCDHCPYGPRWAD
jgi:hypothetical protein